ncbi:MAG TPA: YbhN family protein [Candidatus Limnocylindrales bacterium]|nr:YbhN family protein [Candidatus Limnocylindrales bacterium]
MSTQLDTHARPPSMGVVAARWIRRVRPAGRLRRVVPILVWLGLGTLVLALLVPQAGVLGASIGALGSVDPVWAAAAGLLVVLRYAMAAVSLQAAVSAPLPFRDTALVQLASSFVGRLTPEGVGWLILNQRYLERSGLKRSSAAAGIALKVASGAITRLAIMIVVALSVGGSGRRIVDVPDLPGAAAIAGVLLTAGVLMVGLRRLPPGARVRLAPIASAANDLRAVLRQPRRATVLFVSSAVLTMSLPLALSASLLALGATVSPVDVAAVYLGGTAIAALSPTPGNIGAVEVVLAAGLTGLGVPSATALASVLVFRLLTFWAPVIPGFIAFRSLQRAERL